MQSRKVGWIVAAGGLMLGCVPSALGASVPIAYQTQSRSVSANSTATGFARGGTNTTPTTDTQNQSQQANGFGIFSGNASVTSAMGPGSPMATASGSQQSSLNINEIDASGAVRADSSLGLGAGPSNSSSATSFHITFNVAQAEGFAFTTNLNGSNDPAIPGNTSASIQLTDSLGNNVFAPISTVNLINFQTQGTLAAGLYNLTFDAQATSNDESNNFVNYSFALAAGDNPLQLLGATAIPTGPVAVPLPAAAPMTLSVLAGLGFAGYLRSRARRHVNRSIA
jgi:hypothetical protein